MNYKSNYKALASAVLKQSIRDIKSISPITKKNAYLFLKGTYWLDVFLELSGNICIQDKIDRLVEKYERENRSS